MPMGHSFPASYGALKLRFMALQKLKSKRSTLISSAASSGTDATLEQLNREIRHTRESLSRIGVDPLMNRKFFAQCVRRHEEDGRVAIAVNRHYANYSAEIVVFFVPAIPFKVERIIDHEHAADNYQAKFFIMSPSAAPEPYFKPAPIMIHPALMPASIH